MGTRPLPPEQMIETVPIETQLYGIWFAVEIIKTNFELIAFAKGRRDYARAAIQFRCAFFPPRLCGVCLCARKCMLF